MQPALDDSNPWASLRLSSLGEPVPTDLAVNEWFRGWQSRPPMLPGDSTTSTRGVNLQDGTLHHDSGMPRSNREDSPGEINFGEESPSPNGSPRAPSQPSSPVSFDVGSSPQLSPRPAPIDVQPQESNASRSPSIIDFGLDTSDPASPELIDFDLPTGSPASPMLIDFGFSPERAEVEVDIGEAQSVGEIDFGSSHSSDAGRTPQSEGEINFGSDGDSVSSQGIVGSGRGVASQLLQDTRSVSPPPAEVNRPLSPLQLEMLDEPGSPMEVDFGGPSPTPSPPRPGMIAIHNPPSAGEHARGPQDQLADNMLGDFQVPDFLLLQPVAEEIPETLSRTFDYNKEKSLVEANLIAAAAAASRMGSVAAGPDFETEGADRIADNYAGPLMAYSPSIQAATRYGYQTAPEKRILPSFLGVFVSHNMGLD